MTGYRAWLVFALLAIGWAGLPKAAAAPAPAGPVGVWATAGELSHVEVKPCGAPLCGDVVWLKEPLDKSGKPKTDILNSDPGLRSRKILGLRLLSGFVKAADAGKWDSGLIYNPQDGKTYHCTLTMEDADHMTVRGYVGVPLFGKSEQWTRVK